MCAFGLAVEETTIWAGGATIQSPAPLVAIVKPLAHAIAGDGYLQAMAPTYAVLWLLQYVVFVPAFWACTRDASPKPGKTAWLLALQALATLVGDGQLTLGVAAQIAYYYEWRRAVPALAGLIGMRILADLPFLFGMTGMHSLDPFTAAYYLGYQVRDLCIVFGMGHIAYLVWQSRARLEQANAELRATEQELADAERDAERVRIARDLHDSVGHQLTAINLHLDLGMRKAEAGVEAKAAAAAPDAIPDAVRQARALAGAVLSKLRVAVSREAGTGGAPERAAAPAPAWQRASGHADLFAWLGVAACLYGLSWDQAAIWIGGWPRLTFESIYPLCKRLMALLLPGEASAESAWRTVHALAWGMFYGLFALAFWNANKTRPEPSSRKLALLWWAQIVLAVVWHGQYLYAVLLQAAYRLPQRRALLWFGIVVAASVAAVGPYLAGWTDFSAVGTISLWYFPLRILRDLALFFGAGRLAQTVTRQRTQLAGANREMHEARRRLGEAVRVAERLRIAGELSETLDRDLAALNRQLDLGLHDSSAQLAQSVGVAHEAGRQLFASIRGAIERDKAAQAADLSAALRALCEAVPQPRVTLTVNELPPVEPGLAHSLYCCVQEGLTNAVRHAGAETLTITLCRDAAAFELVIADDGAGMRDAQEGNGLRGIRSRVRSHGGSMHVESGKGCRIVIRIPAPRENLQEQT